MKSMNILHSLIEKAQNIVEASIPTVVLLGILIFVHELGHFLVAKYNKVRVETFSLGFGPKIFKYKWGETTYALSLIPLGGYVKMFGDDPSVAVSEEDKKFSFTHKTLKQKTAVVLAGPLMNFFFAILIYTVMSVYGEQAVSPIVGDLEPTSAAAIAGLKSGDTILKVGQTPVKTWEELQAKIEESGNQKLSFDILREGSGEKSTLSVTPQIVDNKNVLSWDDKVGEVGGLSFYSRVSFVGVSNTQSLASQAGVRTGDLIVEVQGQKLDKWRSLVSAVSAAAKTQDKIEMKVQHDAAWNTSDKEGASTAVVLNLPADVKGLEGEALMNKLGLESP